MLTHTSHTHLHNFSSSQKWTLLDEVKEKVTEFLPFILIGFVLDIDCKYEIRCFFLSSVHLASSYCIILKRYQLLSPLSSCFQSSTLVSAFKYCASLLYIYSAALEYEKTVISRDTRKFFLCVCVFWEIIYKRASVT